MRFTYDGGWHKTPLGSLGDVDGRVWLNVDIGDGAGGRYHGLEQSTSHGNGYGYGWGNGWGDGDNSGNGGGSVFCAGTVELSGYGFGEYTGHGDCTGHGHGGGGDE